MLKSLMGTGLRFQSLIGTVQHDKQYYEANIIKVSISHRYGSTGDIIMKNIHNMTFQSLIGTVQRTQNQKKNGMKTCFNLS